MIKRISVLFLLLFVSQSALFSLGMQEKASDTFDTALSEGTVLYNQGDLLGAAQQFNLAAASLHAETAAFGYYNQGTVLAEMAEQSQDTEEKRTLLTSAYDSLKRSVDLKALSDEDALRARQNMQIVRERLLQLPPEQESDNQQDQQDQQNENQQTDENQQNSQNSDNSQSGDSGQQNQPDNQGQNSQPPQTPDDLLAQQKELSDKTQNGNESDLELARQQEELQKATEEAAQQNIQNSETLNEAAEQQSNAAESLKQGDRGKAAEHQQLAEEALARAADEEKGEQEMDDILNQEADYEEQKNRLDTKGGISDAERNW